MIAAWMLYCVAVGLLLLLAATTVERFLSGQGSPTRRVWAGALLGTVLLPAAAVIFKDTPPVIDFGGEVLVVSSTGRAVASGVETLALLDGVLTSLWALASAALGLLLIGVLVRTRIKAGAWRSHRIDGVPVLLSESVGPAVVGVARSRIVMPRWVLDMPSHERAMMLRHEQEHVRAGDPQLVLFGVLLAVAMPWNPAVWAMLHRLRLAVEVDCDRRVLGGEGSNLRRYAELLLTVGTLRSGPAYGVGFSVGRPFLEQRIDRMTRPASGRRRAHGLLLAAGVVGVLAAAWSLPQPVRASSIDQSTFACPNTDDGSVARSLLGSVNTAG